MSSPTSSSTTPIKSANPHCYSPIVLPRSPGELAGQQNITGLPRVTRDIVADVYNNIQKWNCKHVSGAKLVQQIAVIKSDTEMQMLPSGLEPVIKELYEIVQCLAIHANALIDAKNKISALVKSQKQPQDPVFYQLPLIRISDIINDIAVAYSKEFKAKEMILENIAYAKDKEEALFYAASWVHQIHVTRNLNFQLEIILVETGHHKIA